MICNVTMRGYQERTVGRRPYRRRRSTRRSTRRSFGWRFRDGIATVECAVCLPIFVAITMATIELCSAMFLKESLTLAAYEGARIGVERGGTDAIVRNAIEDFLEQRGVSYDEQSITISDPGFDDAETLQHVTITVSVPCQNNMPLTGGLFTSRSLAASVTMRKEFENL